MTAGNVLHPLLCLKSNTKLNIALFFFGKRNKKRAADSAFFYLHLMSALGLLFTLYRTVADVITMEHTIPAYLLGKRIGVLLGF